MTAIGRRTFLWRGGTGTAAALLSLGSASRRGRQPRDEVLTVGVVLLKDHPALTVIRLGGTEAARPVGVVSPDARRVCIANGHDN